METMRCLICGYHEKVDDDSEMDECPECGSEDIYYSENFSNLIIDDDYLLEDDDDEIVFEFNENEIYNDI